jgi:hypothetical protein
MGKLREPQSRAMDPIKFRMRYFIGSRSRSSDQTPSVNGLYSAATLGSSNSTTIETRGTCLLPIRVSKVCGSRFTP